MKCLVCDRETVPAFSKLFDRDGLGRVDYRRCPDCGTLHAATLLEMEEAAWRAHCRAYHGAYQGHDGGVRNEDDPNWLERMRRQASSIDRFNRLGGLPTSGRWLDYGCGDGLFGRMLGELGYRVEGYDPYMAADVPCLSAGAYAVVINLAVLEHMRDRAGLDMAARLAAPDGVLIFHTLVRGEIPDDADWFYLLPVHTLCLTNRAMSILCADWGFAASVYDPAARLWFACRRSLEEWKADMPALGDPDLYDARSGFAAYWP